MDFFETVAGQRFTEYTVPMLVKELEKINNRQQYCEMILKADLVDGINKEIEQGARVVSMMDKGNGYAAVVFEKTTE